MWTSKRFRTVSTLSLCVAILLISVIIAKGRCQPSNNFFAGGDSLATYVGSALFFVVGFSHIVQDCLSLLLFRLGLEKEFQPVRFFAGDPPSDRELTKSERAFVGYPISAILAGVGLWQWFLVNGCDVVVRPMQGIPA